MAAGVTAFLAALLATMMTPIAAVLTRPTTTREDRTRVDRKTRAALRADDAYGGSEGCRGTRSGNTPRPDQPVCVYNEVTTGLDGRSIDQKNYGDDDAVLHDENDALLTTGPIPIVRAPICSLDDVRVVRAARKQVVAVTDDSHLQPADDCCNDTSDSSTTLACDRIRICDARAIAPACVPLVGCGSFRVPPTTRAQVEDLHTHGVHDSPSTGGDGHARGQTFWDEFRLACAHTALTALHNHFTQLHTPHKIMCFLRVRTRHTQWILRLFYARLRLSAGLALHEPPGAPHNAHLALNASLHSTTTFAAYTALALLFLFATIHTARRARCNKFLHHTTHLTHLTRPVARRERRNRRGHGSRKRSNTRKRGKYRGSRRDDKRRRARSAHQAKVQDSEAPPPLLAAQQRRRHRAARNDLPRQWRPSSPSVPCKPFRSGFLACGAIKTTGLWAARELDSDIEMRLILCTPLFARCGQGQCSRRRGSHM